MYNINFFSLVISVITLEALSIFFIITKHFFAIQTKSKTKTKCNVNLPGGPATPRSPVSP